eukprot:604271_1
MESSSTGQSEVFQLRTEVESLQKDKQNLEDMLKSQESSVRELMTFEFEDQKSGLEMELRAAREEIQDLRNKNSLTNHSVSLADDLGQCESQIAATSKMYVKCQLCGKKNEFEVPCGLTDVGCFELECGRCKNITSQYGGNRNSDSENDEEPASAGDLDQASTQGDDNIIIAEMISSDTADGSSQGKPEPSGPSIDDNCSTAVSSSSKPKPEASTSSSSSMQDAEKFTPSASPLFVKVEGVTLYGREYIRKCMSNLDPFPDDEFNRLYREFLGDRKRHVERQTRRGVYSGRDVMGACRLTKTQFPELRKIIDKLLSDPASSRPA